MGKPRVRGSHAKIFVTDFDGKQIEIGEVNKFSVKELGELKKSRAIGEHEVTSTKTFEGYDLSFEGGKVDWKLAQLLHAQDAEIVFNRRSPYFQVKQTIQYYGGSGNTGYSETYVYPAVTIYGYNMDIDANDEIMEKFEGFCGERRVLQKRVDAEPVSYPNDIGAIIEKTLGKDSLPKLS